MNSLDTNVRNTCPVLFLQLEVDAQGNSVYRARPGPNQNAGVMPNQPVAFSPMGSEIGPVPYHTSQSFSSADGTSDNPMDTNWGGVIHSQLAVDSGKYDENTVGKQTMVPTPNLQH